MTTEAETVRPEDLKPGDRVRVTLEGRIINAEPASGVVFDTGGWGPSYITLDDLPATITRLPPPVDPDLILARKVVAALNHRVKDYRAFAEGVERGDHDDHAEVQTALAAIKAAKEQG